MLARILLGEQWKQRPLWLCKFRLGSYFLSSLTFQGPILTLQCISNLYLTQPNKKYANGKKHHSPLFLDKWRGGGFSYNQGVFGKSADISYHSYHRVEGRGKPKYRFNAFNILEIFLKYVQIDNLNYTITHLFSVGLLSIFTFYLFFSVLIFSLSLCLYFCKSWNV